MLTCAGDEIATLTIRSTWHRHARPRPWTLLAGVLALAACGEPVVESDEGQLQVHPEGLVQDVAGQASSPALAGDSACLSWVGWRLDPSEPWRPPGLESDLSRCFELSLAGPATLTQAPDTCLSFDAPGEAVLTLSPKPQCVLDDAPVSFAPDTLRIPILSADQVALRARVAPHLLAARALADDPGAVLVGAPSLPPEWGELPAVLRVPHGGGISITTGLVDPQDPDTFVMHEESLLEISSDVASRRPWVDVDRQVSTIQIDEGEQASFLARIGAASPEPFVTVVGTPPCQAASLDLIAVASQGETAQELRPDYVQALVRDANGDLLYGAPIEWSDATGSLSFPPWWSMEEGIQQYSADQLTYIGDMFGFVDEPTPRTVEIVARYCGLEDSLAFSWTQQPRGEVEGTEFPPVTTTGGDSTTGDTDGDAPQGGTSSGCACTSAGPAPGLPALAMLTLGALARRRRPR